MERDRDDLRPARDVRRLIFGTTIMNALDKTKLMREGKFWFTRRALLAGAAVGAAAGLQPSQAGAAVSIDITQGNIQPIPIALPDFMGGTSSDGDVGRNVTQVITANLKRSGLFAPIDQAAYIERVSNIDAVPRFPDWRAINAQALVSGRITRQGDGRLKTDFR